MEEVPSPLSYWLCITPETNELCLWLSSSVLQLYSHSLIVHLFLSSCFSVASNNADGYICRRLDASYASSLR
ncbi:Os02g0687600 [Oryza sativa Japonica Group]|uniref:Os02g0687600 protein n=1 Tax=Oryza sativa subsp. japonica TaxID=39947 RepID=A0A0P0VN76_ORYSJ|nr:Os02g0687600 [Oryza sativa Japonica Group]